MGSYAGELLEGIVHVKLFGLLRIIINLVTGGQASLKSNKELLHGRATGYHAMIIHCYRSDKADGGLHAPTLGASKVMAVTGMRSPPGLSPTRLIWDHAISKAHIDASAPPNEWPARQSCSTLSHISLGISPII